MPTIEQRADQLQDLLEQQMKIPLKQPPKYDFTGDMSKMLPLFMVGSMGSGKMNAILMMLMQQKMQASLMQQRQWETMQKAGFDQTRFKVSLQNKLLDLEIQREKNKLERKATQTLTENREAQRALAEANKDATLARTASEKLLFDDRKKLLGAQADEARARADAALAATGRAKALAQDMDAMSVAAKNGDIPGIDEAEKQINRKLVGGGDQPLAPSFAEGMREDVIEENKKLAKAAAVKSAEQAIPQKTLGGAIGRGVEEQFGAGPYQGPESGSLSGGFWESLPGRLNETAGGTFLLSKLFNELYGLESPSPQISPKARLPFGGTFEPDVPSWIPTPHEGIRTP